MLPHWHLLFALLFFIPLHLFFGFLMPLELLIAIAASILVDADHVLFFSIKLRTLSLKRIWNHCRELSKKSKIKSLKLWFLLPFHNILALAVFYILYFPIFIGMLFHVISDLLYAIIICRPWKE